MKRLILIRKNMSKSPITVQQWVESLPTGPAAASSPTASSYASPQRGIRKLLPRELSVQSDEGSSHCSSVESVLEMRRPDPEAVLLGLGFGPPRGTNLLARIPSRFLQPSKLVSKADFDQFIRLHSETRYQENSAPACTMSIRPNAS